MTTNFFFHLGQPGATPTALHSLIYRSLRIVSTVVFSRVAFFAGTDVVISADTDAAGTEVDVGASLDLLEAAAFAGTRGRPALAR